METKPIKSEFPEYYSRYVDIVPVGNIINLLEKQSITLVDFFSGISEKKSLFRYAKGKWSIKEILGHLIDAERILAYRILRYVRNDKTDLPQFDENNYVKNSRFDNILFIHLIEEFRALRYSNLLLFRRFGQESLLITGTAESNEFTVRAILNIIYGHTAHHLKIVEEQYL